MVDLVEGTHEFAVVDVETTGLYWRRDRVVSVAVARCNADGHPIEQWYSLVNPGCPMKASEIHGLTDVSVAHAPSFEHIADELLAQLGGAVLVGHNVTFDWRFLSNEYARGGETLPEHDAVCTLSLARALDLGTENMKLDAVAATAKCRSHELSSTMPVRMYWPPPGCSHCCTPWPSNRASTRSSTWGRPPRRSCTRQSSAPL